MRALLVLPLVLAGCQVGPQPLRGPDEATQIGVMEQCRAGFGLGGDAEYQVNYGPAAGGGRTVNVLALPQGQVTAHWADRINDCAAAQLDIVPLAAPVAGTDPDAPRGICGAGVSMTRGTLYCRVAG